MTNFECKLYMLYSRFNNYANCQMLILKNLIKLVLCIK